jgi:hypothetical protein
MSADDTAVARARAVHEGTRNFALRIAIGVTASFGIAEALDWDTTFLAPMLAAQFLIKMTQPPNIRQAMATVVIIAFASGGMAFLSAALLATPAVLVLVLALVLFLSYYAHARGAPDMLTLMIQVSAVTVPIFAVISPAAGAAFAALFAKAGLVAVFVVWGAFALFPAPKSDPGSARAGSTPVLAIDAAAGLALRNTLVLMPVLLWYLLDTSQIAVVMLVTMVMLLRQIEEGMHGRMAAALILANILGGVVANIAYIVVGVTDQFFIFVLVLLASSLGFAGQIAQGGTRAALLAVAFGTFILLLGTGISPLPGGSDGAFITRIVYIVFAAIFTIGALSLFDRRTIAQPTSR